MAPESSDLEFEILRRALPRLLGSLSAEALAAIRPHLVWEWVERAGGEILCREGEPSDSIYAVVSGRLQASVAGPGNQSQVVGEIGRGESVGEMGAFTGEPRRATVMALRDTLLVRIELAAFHEILKAAPELALNLNRVIIERLQRRNTSHKATHNVVNIAVVPINEGVDANYWLGELGAELQAQGQTGFHLTSAVIDASAGRPGAAQAADENRNDYYWLVQYLDELEGRYSLVFYEADPSLTPWTLRCLRQADEIVLLGKAEASPALSSVESAHLAGEKPAISARQTLVLLHPAGRPFAIGASRFLAARPNVSRHFHLRTGTRKDLARLARFLSGRAVGLVLAGGGARGLAHIGVYRALEEAGVAVDAFGGSSIGAVLGACMAADWGWEKVYSENRRAFLSNPTSDFNFVPLVSLLAGRKLERTLERSFPGTAIEELWQPFFCVSTSYTRACEVVHTRGNLKRALLASTAIPGVFPPVAHGTELLLDGGIFNNLPVDVMARSGVRNIIAVDLRSQGNVLADVSFEEMPSAWNLLLDRLKPKARRRFAVPSLITTLMDANTLSGQQRTTEALGDVDLHLRPNTEGFGPLEWKSYDAIVQRGYEYARAVIAKGLPF